MRELGEATRAFAKAKATRMRLISILLSLSRSLILRAGGGPLLFRPNGHDFRRPAPPLPNPP